MGVYRLGESTVHVQSIHGPRGLLRRLSDDRMNGALREMAEETAELIEAAIIRRMPEDEGNLKRSLEVVVDEDQGGRVQIRIQTDPRIAPYAVGVDQGTGIYGPRQRPIRARDPRRPMRFYWAHLGKKSVHGGYMTLVGKHMVLTEVQGQQGQHFFRLGWRAGMEQARKRFTHILREM